MSAAFLYYNFYFYYQGRAQLLGSNLNAEQGWKKIIYLTQTSSSFGVENVHPLLALH
jgi:hypothetical protein